MGSERLRLHVRMFTALACAAAAGAFAHAAGPAARDWVPAVLLTTIGRIGSVEVISRVSGALQMLPDTARDQIRGGSPAGQTGYALAVFLFAPMAVIVPLTISTAVGAATLVGERERGTGEFLAHSPASAREIYLGKLIASLLPGYATVVVGFGVYSLIVNVTVGPAVGGWFFPTAQWWVMILWVLPPFLAICLSLVLRLSARVSSTAAAQQASGLVSLPLIGIADNILNPGFYMGYSSINYGWYNVSPSAWAKSPATADLPFVGQVRHTLVRPTRYPWGRASRDTRSTA